MKKITKQLLALALPLGMVLSAQADAILTTTFTAAPGNNSSPTNIFEVFSTGAGTTVVNGSAGLPTTGNLLDGSSGSFKMTWTAESNYNPVANSGEIGNGWQYDGSRFEFGPNTDTDTGIQIMPGEAVRMVFDLNGFTLGADQTLVLNNIQSRNSTGGRVSFYDASAGTITLLAGGTGSISMPNADPYLIPLTQAIDDGDQIIMWREVTGSGQYRIEGFEFAVVPEPATIGLFAIFGTAIVVFRRRFIR